MQQSTAGQGRNDYGTSPGAYKEDSQISWSSASVKESSLKRPQEAPEEPPLRLLAPSSLALLVTRSVVLPLGRHRWQPRRRPVWPHERRRALPDFERVNA